MRRFNPLRAFADPVTRPRAIILSGIALIFGVIFWAGGIIGTSTYWFCTTPCHKVHDDNTAAYLQSTHTNVSCIACHEPVNASPLVFTKMKIHVLPDLPATIFNYFSLPANEFSHVAKEMPSEQCTQCHNLATRPVSAKQGLLIDHEAHEKRDITCATCHNRVAHPEENIELKLAGNRKHENWMTMDGCFRCHSLEKKAEAPGACATCHSADYDLTPASHDTTDWVNLFGDSRGHAKAAFAESESVEAALARAEKAEGGHGEASAAEKELPSSSSINSCYTCHERSYCDSCHGTEMPHPASFRKSHSATAPAAKASCGKCHATSEAAAKSGEFCSACHHTGSTPGTPWRQQHPEAARRTSAKPCFECHEPTSCARCHVRISPQL